MNKLVKLSWTGGAECQTAAGNLQEAIQTMPEWDGCGPPGGLLGPQTMLENAPEETLYLLLDGHDRILECRGDLEFIHHPRVLRRLAPLLESGAVTWQPYQNILHIMNRKVSAGGPICLLPPS